MNTNNALPANKSHKYKNCIHTVSNFFIGPQDAGKQININQSWLPLTDDPFQLELINKYRTLGVFPTLHERAYVAVNSSIVSYTAKNNWLHQAYRLLVRPFAFDEVIKNLEVEDPKITDIILSLRPVPVEDKPIIEGHTYNELKNTLNSITDIFFEYLEKEGINTEPYKKLSDRSRFPAMLGDNPFLAYAIFERLPKLGIFTYAANIKGIKANIVMIQPSLVSITVDTDWLVEEPIVQIVI